MPCSAGDKNLYNLRTFKNHRIMRKIALVLTCAMQLSAFGPRPPYDAAALPDAAAAREHLLNDCQARAATLKTDRARVTCGLAAHRAYAVTEKLRDLKLFQTYAAEQLRIAGDVDAGRLDQMGAYKHSTAARVAYQSAVEKQYADWRAGQAASRKAPLFDPAALPAASAARARAVNACGSWTDKSIETRTHCILGAEKTFAAAIHLQDMDLFYGYASVLRVDAVDAEDGKRTMASMQGEHQRLWSDFLRTLNQAYAGWAKGR